MMPPVSHEDGHPCLKTRKRRENPKARCTRYGGEHDDMCDTLSLAASTLENVKDFVACERSRELAYNSS